MNFVKLTLPDGKPLYLWPDPPPAAITYDNTKNGAEITLQNGIVFKVDEYPSDVVKSIQNQRVSEKG